MSNTPDSIEVEVVIDDTRVVAVLPDGTEWFLMSREKLARMALGEFNED